MNNKKRKLLLITTLLIILVTSFGTYAIYKSTATGTSGFKTAKWYIELNGEDITTSNIFTFDLKQANWTHNAVIDSDETELVVIAPGSYGTFGIEIDATETEVDVSYEIFAVVKQNDTVIDLSTINSNLSFGFYENDELKDNPLIGNITAHGTYNGEIRIVWNEVDSNSANFQDININDQDFVVEVTVNTFQKPLDMPICRRATTLHTETCSRTSGGCYDAGYYSGGSKGTTTITYGNETTTKGKLMPGDAFDCDVNGDGVYDSTTERFYYVTSSGDNAVLLYYTNVARGVATAGDETYSYATQDSITRLGYTCSQKNGCNNYGPLIAYQQLPSLIQWSNEQIIAPGTRQIVTETSSPGTPGGTIKSFTYTNKAARLLTMQEVGSSCGLTIGNYLNGELDKCNYLLENTTYGATSGKKNYWLETPYTTFATDVWSLNGTNRNRFYNNRANSTLGVRPVITVLKSNIKY